MDSLSAHSIRNPTRVVVAATIITVILGLGVLRLELRTDGLALVPTRDAAVLADRQIRDAFGLEDQLVVLIRANHPDGVFNLHTLRLVDQLTAQLRTLPGVDSTAVYSLATERGDRMWPGTLRPRPFLRPFPESEEDLQQIREDVLAIGLYSGTLLSYDETATTILIGVPPTGDRAELFRSVSSVLASVSALTSAPGSAVSVPASTPGRTPTVDLIGAPVAEALLGLHILQDLGVPTDLGSLVSATSLDDRAHSGSSSELGEASSHDGRSWLHGVRTTLGRTIGLAPLAIVIMALVFFLAYRSWVAVMLPLVEVLACLVAVFGLMGWLGVPIYLTIAVLPVILTAIATADEVHIFTRYRQLRARHAREDVVSSVRETMHEMAPPVVKTSLTTAVGFLSFSLSPIGPVAAFGLLTAFGILFCMFWSLTVIPALLVQLQPMRRSSKRRESQGRLVDAGVRPAPDDVPLQTSGAPLPPDETPILPAASMPIRWLLALSKRRGLALGLLFVLLLLVPLGIRQLRVQDSWIGGFARESRFHQVTRFFDEQFFGSHILRVHVDAGRTELRGTLPESRIGHHDLRFPVDLTDRPQALVGADVRIERGSGSASGRLDDAERNRTHRPVYRPDWWVSRVVSATVTDSCIRVTMDRKRGSPRFAMRPSPGDSLRFEIVSRGLRMPEVIRAIADFESFLSRQDDLSVGGVLGPGQYIATTSFIVMGRDSLEHVIPDDPERIEWLWNQYGRVRRLRQLRQAVDPELQSAIVSVFLENANFTDTAELMSRIRSYEDEHFTPKGLEVGFAGDVAVSQALIGGIVSTQVRSLVLSLVGIFLVAALLSRSLRWALYIAIPSALAVLVNFAVMGWSGIPLGVATSMFTGMVLGIGVDFAIHLTERYRRVVSTGSGPEVALHDAMSTVGPAILIDSAAVSMGFGLLVLSQVPANARLGGLVVVGIATCLIATLVILPALIHRSDGHRRRNPADRQTTL